MTDSTAYRRCVKTEWVEPPTTAASPSGVPATPSHSSAKAIINNVTNSAFASIDKKAVLVGGVNPKTGRSVSQSLEFDLITKTWSSLGTWFPMALSDAAMVSCGSVCYVLFGGWDDESVLGDLWIAPQKADEGGSVHLTSWTRVAVVGDAPCPRRGHCMVVAAPRDAEGPYTIYTFGGFNGETRLNDLWSIEVAQDGTISKQWVQIIGEGETPAPRDGCSFAYDFANHRLVVFGGFTTSLEHDVTFFDIAANRWSKQPFQVGPSKRQYSFGVCHHQYFICMLGHDGKQILNQVCQLSLGDLKWSLVHFEGDEIDPRQYSSVCLAEGGKKVLVFGGLSAQKRYLSSVLELELEKCEVVAVGKGKK